MKTLKTKTLLLTLFVMFSNFCSAEEKKVNEIFSGGRVFPIEEVDAFEDIKARAETADVQKFINATPRSKWSIWKGYPMPVSLKNIQRVYVPWYELEMDIKDHTGKIIYPKGFTFNPLQHMKLPQRVVIYKVGQFDKIKPFLKQSDILIIDAGNTIDETEKTGIHTYILSQQIANRLGLKSVPSFVEQIGSHLKITEVNVIDL